MRCYYRLVRAKSEWTKEEKARWWERYHRENRELVIVPAVPLHDVTEVEVDPTTLGELDDEAFGEGPGWGPGKGSC